MTLQILTATFTFVIGLTCFWMAARLRGDSRKSRYWPTVSGKLVDHGIETLQSDAQSFTPKLNYSYTVAGQEYTGQQVYRTGRVGWSRQRAQKLVDGLPAAIPVHYNPENPSDAFLLATPSSFFWITTAFGIGAVVWGLLQVVALVMP